MLSLALRSFDLKSGVSGHVLEFYEDFNETSENIIKIVDIQIKTRLCSPTCIRETVQMLSFGKFHSVYRLLSKWNGKILPIARLAYDTAKESISLPARCDVARYMNGLINPITSSEIKEKTAQKRYDLLICDIEAFMMKIVG